MALMLPPRFRDVEHDVHDTVSQHLKDSGFNDVDISVEGQSAQLRWRGLAPAGSDAAALRDNLTHAAEEAASARPQDWPFGRFDDWSAWVTAPVITAVADESSVPNLPPPPPAVATESDPRQAADTETASASSQAAPALPAPAPTPAAVPVSASISASASVSVAASCTDKVTAAISGRRLHFVSSSAQLTSDSDAVLDSIYKVVRSCPAGLRLEIDGYTDNVGPDKPNLTLSFERARAAAAALVKRGLPQNMVGAHGFGPQSPVASNATDAGRAANRRVIFILRPA